MIREGEPEVTLKFLAQNPHRKLAINHFTEGTSPDSRSGACIRGVVSTTGIAAGCRHDARLFATEQMYLP
jgi:hypothetical protein